MTVTKLDLQSKNIVQDNIEKLKQLFPEIVTEDKIDFYKLREVLGEEIEDNDEKYEFTWKGKHDAIRESQKTSHGTLRPCPQESKNWDTTQNLYIEGDNLEVLKLLQKSYQSKIKMMYIDPPYNTGKKDEFVYNDDYRDNLKNYLELDENDSSNPESSGRYHTKWLNMIYPRLKLARNLLKEDGVIFISIDDNELNNLKKICDEIFGENNYVSTIVWEKNFAPKNNNKYISTSHEYALCYAKNKEKFSRNLLPREEKHNKGYTNPDNDERGPWSSGTMLATTFNENYVFGIEKPDGTLAYPKKGRCWRFSKETIQKLLDENRIWFGKDGHNVPRIKRFLTEVPDGIVPKSLWKYDEVGSYQDATNNLRKLFDNIIFNFSKPVNYIKRMLIIGSDDEDIIMDFFSGSGTTSEAIFELNKEKSQNRRFIMVQIPEKTNKKSNAFKANYENICEIGKERIRRAGDKLLEENPNTDVDIGFKVLKLDSSNFKEWNPSESPLEEYIEGFEDNIKSDRNELDLIYEIMIKYGIDLTAHIDEVDKDNYTFYSIGAGALIVCLNDTVNEDVTDDILSIVEDNVALLGKDNSRKNRVVFKDDSFVNDSVKTNIINTLENNSIEDIITY